MTPNDDSIVTGPDVTDLPDFDPGGLPSPPDPRDLPIADAYVAAGVEAATVFPATFIAGMMPPVLNQGTTPECVAFSSAAVRGHQDRLDQGQYFDFDKGKFFVEIGGGPNGAYLRAAMDRMKNFGYPVVSVGQESAHKISAYYAVPVTVADWKAALMAFGPINIRLDWYHSFNRPVNGILPAPDYRVGGHAIVVYGWDDAKGFRLRNSWGPLWGLAGDGFMPFSFFSKGLGLEAWKTIDVIEAPPAPVDPSPYAHTVKVSGVASLGLNVHATPHQAGAVLGHLAPLQQVKTVELLAHGEKYLVGSAIRTDWLEIVYGTKKGWIKRGWTVLVA